MDLECERLAENGSHACENFGGYSGSDAGDDEWPNQALLLGN